MVRAGLFDDPFYLRPAGLPRDAFDGNAGLPSDRDFFRGQNDTGIIIQIPRAAVDRDIPIRVWATSDRFGGNI